MTEKEMEMEDIDPEEFFLNAKDSSLFSDVTKSINNRNDDCQTSDGNSESWNALAQQVVGSESY